MNLILGSRGQLLTASLSQCWSQLANEVGDPRAANDILLPCQFSFFFCRKFYVGIESWSCAYSCGTCFFWWSMSCYPTAGLSPPGGSSSPLPTLLSSWAAEFINWSVLGRGGAEEGTSVRKSSDSICFVPGSKQRGYCLLIDCFWKAVHMGPGEFQR